MKEYESKPGNGGISDAVKHTPVLLHEILELLAPAPGKFFIDGTLGGGGHARAIAEKLVPGGTLLGIDWDERGVEIAERALLGVNLKKLIVRKGNYRDLPKILEEEGLGEADGLLLDLGFSSGQLEGGRGFSFRKDEPLHMTYNDETLPLYAVLPQLTERELTEIIRTLSDERYAARIAGAIKEAGRKEPIVRTGHLAQVIQSAVPRNYERGRIDPATRTFMALRMYVNDELGNLESALRNIRSIVASGGRVAVISFHSKEDRLVKHYFRDMAQTGEAELLTKKPIQASGEEAEKNPNSRSAKLRAIKVH